MNSFKPLPFSFVYSRSPVYKDGAERRTLGGVIHFSRDYSDIPRQLLEYSNDSNILKAISDYAKAADVGIEDTKFEINSKEINEESDLPENIPDEVKAATV